MNSPFNTTTFSNDEDINNDLELYSIKDQNYIGPKGINLFDEFPGELNNETKEKDNLSMEEFIKIFSMNNLIKDNPDFQVKRNTILFSLKTKKSRGKQTKDNKKPQHLSTDFDNLQRKIQIHFFTFIINLSNDAIKAVLDSKSPYNFKQIDHQLKILISHDTVNQLHKSAIKDILKMRISPKNKKYSEKVNQETLNAVCNCSPLLKKFFNINYLEFFNDFYFNEEEETNKIVFEGIEIPFSKQTKNFYHLLKKYENYKILLINSAKSVYFYGYDTLISKNSFLTSKKDIELKESDN
jgi:hypothetical protein